MLSDYEQRQLALIEQGFAEDDRRPVWTRMSFRAADRCPSAAGISVASISDL